MAQKRRTVSRVFYLLSILILAAGALLWFSDLTSDPPMYYSGLGQSLATDPHQYVFHARNKILFGQADPYDYPRWTVYEHSLTSLAAYVWFFLSELSLKNANAVGVILSLGGLVFFLLGLSRHHRPWVLAAVAFLYVINITLLTYGRLPYLENGLIFIAGLMFFVYSWWGHRLAGVIIAGVLAALAAFAGKLFGVLLLPTLILSVLISNGEGRARRSLFSAIAFVVAGAAIVMVFYGEDFRAAFSYVSEQTYGIKGYPAGLTSPWSFLEHLVSFGFQNRLFYRSPDVFMFLLCCGAMMVFVFGERLWNQPRTTVFSFVWMVIVFLGLMPHAYSPVRYSLLLIPAVVLSCCTLVDHVLRERKISLVVPGTIGTILLVFCFWFAFYHVISNLFFFNQSPGRWLVWVILPGAVLLAVGARILFSKWRPAPGRYIGVVFLVLIIALSATANGFRYRRLDVLEHNFNIAEAGEDIQNIVGPGAVISGPYAPALTIDNRIRSFIYLFGVAEVDATLFDRYPITHIAVDKSNLEEARKAYPQLEKAPVVARYWIRDYEVMIVKISDLFSNRQANSYEASDYERAVLYTATGATDSAKAALNRHLTRRPMTKSAGKLAGEILLAGQEYEKAVRIWRQLADTYPTDFHVQMRAGEVLLALALGSNNHVMMDEARGLLARGVAVNRYKANYANQIVTDLFRKYRQETP